MIGNKTHAVILFSKPDLVYRRTKRICSYHCYRSNSTCVWTPWRVSIDDSRDHLLRCCTRCAHLQTWPVYCRANIPDHGRTQLQWSLLPRLITPQQLTSRRQWQRHHTGRWVSYDVISSHFIHHAASDTRLCIYEAIVL